MKYTSFAGAVLAVFIVIGAFGVSAADAHAGLDYYAQTGGSSYGSSYGGYYSNSYNYSNNYLGYYNNYYGYGNYYGSGVNASVSVYPSYSYYDSGTRGNVALSYYGRRSSVSLFFGF